MMISIQFLFLLTICVLASGWSRPKNWKVQNKLEKDEELDIGFAGPDPECGKCKAKKVIGGSPVGHVIPFQVAIYVESDTGIFFCGGTIISKDFIMTAAHCTKDEDGNTVDPEDVTVTLGAYIINFPGRTDGVNVTVSDVIPHPDYNESNFRNDIALLKLEAPIDFDDYPQLGSVCLPDTEELLYKPDDNVTLSGWGINNNDQLIDPPSNFPPSYALQKVDIPVVKLKECKKAYNPQPDNEPKDRFVTIRNICAGSLNKGSCSGDSGGPLFIENKDDDSKCYQIGIVSFGSFPCALDDGLVGVFTNVRYFREWIDDATAATTTSEEDQDKPLDLSPKE